MAARLIWVTGAGGLIGSHIVAIAPQCAADVELLPLTRLALELTDFSALKAALLRHPPAVVIHCAALSRSPECQANPTLAHKVNVEVTTVLAEIAERLVFFSTDLVFDGRLGNYDESAEVNPLSVYAETKVAAERIVLTNPKHLVVRTSLNCGASPTGDRGFDEQLLRAWQAGQTLQLFTDEFRSPIPVEATARAVWELVAQNRTGLYHVAGSERLSRWQIGQRLVTRYPQFGAQIEPGSLKEYKGARRPPDTSLNCAKAQNCLSFPLPRLSEWLKSQA